MKPYPAAGHVGQQGHLPTIEKMLAKHQSWEAIGKAIGWCPNTACRHYANHLRAKVAALEETIKRLEEQINGL